MANLTTSDLEKIDEDLDTIVNSPCQTKMFNFNFENNQHPLLINTVLKDLFKSSSVADLKNFRLVCKDWNFEAFQILKTIEWKSPILFQTSRDLTYFVKTFGPCPQNILNRNLDCAQILVPSDKEPEIFFHKILPITSYITGLKVNINIQQEQTFVAHEVFQHLAQTLRTFDVRFIKNDNICLSAHTIYPRTHLPSLPALTSVTIRMDGFAKYENRIIHPECGQNGYVIFDSEYKMLTDLIQELVKKSPLLSEIRLIMSNYTVLKNMIYNRYVENRQDSFQHKSIDILTKLKPNELMIITHLRFDIFHEENITDLLKLAKSGLNKLRYIKIDFVGIEGELNQPGEGNLLGMLECQKATLEYFKLKNSSENSAGDATIQLPTILPKLNVLKLGGSFTYNIDLSDLNTRFPNLNEIDLTGGLGLRSQFNVDYIPAIPHVKKLQLDDESFERYGLSNNIESRLSRLSQFFPNVTQIKYHMESTEGADKHGRVVLWTMSRLEHLVLKVPSEPQMLLSLLKMFLFISGGMTEHEIDGAQDPANFLAQSSPNITWLTGLKSLKLNQTRRYGCPGVRDESGDGCQQQRYLIERLGVNLLTNMQNLEHFSTDFHCFSEDSIVELRLKIPDFEPGTSIDHIPLPK